MAIEARYQDIVQAATDVIARRGYHHAPIREIARGAGLSLAGLYHYVGGKEEMLFLVLDHWLDVLLGGLDRAQAQAGTPESRLLALISTHLAFGSRHPAALTVINRDGDVLGDPRGPEVAAKRDAYVQRALVTLRDLDPHGRSRDALLSATSLLLGMLNGIARPPFIGDTGDVEDVAGVVAALFLHGFLDRSAARPRAAAVASPA